MGGGGTMDSLNLKQLCTFYFRLQRKAQDGTCDVAKFQFQMMESPVLVFPSLSKSLNTPAGS